MDGLHTWQVCAGGMSMDGLHTLAGSHGWWACSMDRLHTPVGSEAASQARVESLWTDCILLHRVKVDGNSLR